MQNKENPIIKGKCIVSFLAIEFDLEIDVKRYYSDEVLLTKEFSKKYIKNLDLSRFNNKIVHIFNNDICIPVEFIAKNSHNDVLWARVNHADFLLEGRQRKVKFEISLFNRRPNRFIGMT